MTANELTNFKIQMMRDTYLNLINIYHAAGRHEEANKLAQMYDKLLEEELSK